MSQRHVHSISLNQEQELLLVEVQEYYDHLSIVDIFMKGIEKYRGEILVDQSGK